MKQFLLLTVVLALTCQEAFASPEEQVEIWGSRGSQPGNFDEPRDVAVAKDGSVYVADFRNYRIQKFSPEGKLLLAWGTKGQDNGQFQDLCGVATAPDGSVWVADTWNHRVQKFTSEGKWILTASPKLFAPKGLWAGNDGKVYIANTGVQNIVILDSKGEEVTSFGTRGAGPGQFVEPTGVCTDSKGNIFVNDSGNHRVQLFDSQGKFLKQIKLGDPSQEPFESWIEVNPENQIIVTYPTDNAVFCFNQDGNMAWVFGGFGRGPGQFERPSGVGIAPDGAIYVTDRWGHRLEKIPADVAPKLPKPGLSRDGTKTKEEQQPAPILPPALQQAMQKQQAQAPSQVQPATGPEGIAPGLNLPFLKQATKEPEQPKDLYLLLVQLLGALAVMFILCFIGVKIGDWRTRRRLMREYRMQVNDVTEKGGDGDDFALPGELRRDE